MKPSPSPGRSRACKPARVYHYRAVASNTNGVVNGLDATFQTTAGLPAVVITDSPSGIGLNGATIAAFVIPNGSDTAVTFEYGLTTAYGSTLEPALDAGSGSGEVMVSATLSGLKPGTMYHYRADATNSAGVVIGGDRNFATTSVTFGDYGGKYSGLFLADPAAVETSGVFTVVVAPAGSFAASGKLGGKNVKFGGVFQNSGAAIVDLPHTGITAHLQLAGSGPGRGINGTLSGSDNAIITAPLIPGAATPGLYTVRIPPPDDQALPPGYGYGSLKVSPTGAVTFSGKLGDGTPVTAGSILVTGSTFPLYVPLYRNAGAIVGNVVFETSSNGVLDASLAWFKPATTTASAFSTPLALYGSAYSPPARNQPVIGVSGGDFVVHLRHGGVQPGGSPFDRQPHQPGPSQPAKGQGLDQDRDRPVHRLVHRSRDRKIGPLRRRVLSGHGHGLRRAGDQGPAGRRDFRAGALTRDRQSPDWLRTIVASGDLILMPIRRLAIPGFSVVCPPPYSPHFPSASAKLDRFVTNPARYGSTSGTDLIRARFSGVSSREKMACAILLRGTLFSP